MKPVRLIAALMLGLAVGSALAAERPALSLDQAVAQVRQETGGKVLSADALRVGRREVIYRIKVLTPAGVVKVVQIKTEMKKEKR